MQWLNKVFLFALLAAAPCIELHARTYISLGYGLQMNAMLNSTLKSSMQNMVLNQSAARLYGISGLQAYDSNWSATTDSTLGPYLFMGLPEVRAVSEWAYSFGRIGVFGSVSGIVPQTVTYYAGNLQLKESNTCSGVNYASCPLAASNFVAASGSAAYEAEVRQNLRSFNFAVGFTFAKTLQSIGKDADLVITGELGLSVQSFAVTTQFAASRCTTGSAAPCATLSQSRVLQGELRSQSVYALGPVVGGSVRYERVHSFWFAELGLSATLLFMQLENSGYTNFVAAGTAAFTQSSAALGIDATQNSIIFLPAVILRFGVHL